MSTGYLSPAKIAAKMGVTRTVIVDRMRRRKIQPDAIGPGGARLYREEVITLLTPYFSRPEARLTNTGK